MTGPLSAASLPGHVRAALSWPPALRALRYRPYRLLLGSQCVSLIGTWMAATTTSWLAFRLTGSPLMLALVAVGTQAPVLALGPVAGPLADRLDRRRLLIYTQLASMATALVLAIAVWTSTLSPPWLIVASVVQGIISAIDMPTRSALVISTIEERDDIANALALGGIVVNGTRMIGAAAGGALIGSVGEAWCYFIDAFTYLVPLAVLLRLTIGAAPARQPEAQTLRQRLVDGWSGVIASPLVRSMAALLAIFTLFGVPYSMLMPVIVTDVLHRGPDVLGRLYGASAGGAVLGSLALARMRCPDLPGTIAGATLAFGAGMIAFASSRTPWLSMAIVATSGCSSVLLLAASHTALQTVAAPELRGRVASCFFMATVGIAPIGALAAGVVSSRIGAAPMLAACGVCCVATAIAFAFRLTPIRDALAANRASPAR